MQGRIIIINTVSRLFAVQLDDGDFVVFEPVGGYSVQANDIVRGNLDALGGEEVMNITQQEKLSVFGQSGRCSLEAARSLVYGR